MSDVDFYDIFLETILGDHWNRVLTKGENFIRAFALCAQCL